ncbi:MAG: bifunctional nuclease family protein [Thermodesulfobacteriota bacterium]
MKHKYFSLIFIVTLILLSTSVYNSQAKKDEGSIQEMEIKGIGFDQNLQTPVVLLTDKEQNSILPIWIGLCEARSIELGLSEKVAPRPLTYDMMAAIIRTIGVKVERIVIVDLRDEVFYAQVEVSVDGKVSKIDARPSDAIALASRMNSPIFVKKAVLDKAALLETDKKKQGL